MINPTITIERKGRVPTALLVHAHPSEIKRLRCAHVEAYGSSNVGVMPLTPRTLEVVHDSGVRVSLTREVVNWHNEEHSRRALLAAAYHNPRKDICDRLYDFQRRSVSFMLEARKVLLADDPRLGKTIQALVMMEELTKETDRPVVIFTLKSLRDYWAESVEKWTTFAPTIVDGAATKRASALHDHFGHRAFITNWETLRLVPAKITNRFKHIIGDECHIVRNRKSAVGRRFMTLRPEVSVMASATMVEHGPEDYFALLRVLYPVEFRSYWRFVGWYCQVKFNGFGNDIVGPKNEDILQDHLAPFSLRRKASEVADVPEKQFETRYIEPSPAMLEAYNKLSEEVLIEINADTKLLIPNALARMVRLKQLSTAPRTLGYDFDSPKIEAIAEYVENLPKDVQVLIYTQFRSSAQDLASRVEGASIFIGGEGDDKAFKAGASRVLVTTTQLGGVGQDYSNAQIIIYADLPLSATLLRQSIERTTKIGIKDPRLILTFACTQTDRAAAETLAAKQELIQDVDLYEAILRYLE